MVASQRPYIKTGIAVPARTHRRSTSIGRRPKAGARYTIVSHAITNLARATMHHLTSGVVPPAGSATALDGIAPK
jgi:hypothetical protein